MESHVFNWHTRSYVSVLSPIPPLLRATLEITAILVNNLKLIFRLSRHFFFIFKQGFLLKKYWTRTGRLSFLYLSENGDREICPKISGCRAPKFFVAYELQILRIEGMKPIESPSAFWKNMDKVFPTGHIKSTRLGSFLGVSSKPAVRWTGSGSFSGF